MSYLEHERREYSYRPFNCPHDYISAMMQDLFEIKTDTATRILIQYALGTLNNPVEELMVEAAQRAVYMLNYLPRGAR